MDKFIIDGSHFGGVLRAVDYMVKSGYVIKDVELVCDEEREIYELRLHTMAQTVLTTIPY